MTKSVKNQGQHPVKRAQTVARKRYWLSFTEEMVLNPKYRGYIGGRIEVHDNKEHSPYASEEIRFFTKNQGEFWGFREQWDWKNIDEKKLEWVKIFVGENYCDKI